MKSDCLKRKFLFVLLGVCLLLSGKNFSVMVMAAEENAESVLEKAGDKTQSMLDEMAEKGSEFLPALEEAGASVGETVGDAAETVRKGGLDILRQVIGFLPLVGVTLFLFGVVVAVFSVRNKGNKRWGIKLAVTEVLIVYLLYIGFTLAYDFLYKRYPVKMTSRPEQTNVYEDVYYGAVEELREKGQNFLLFEHGWLGKATVAGRKAYTDVALLFAFVSFSSGILLFVLTKRDLAIRRLALVGMCVVVPAALIIGYRYLAI